jgi:hypothetical protein
LPTQVRRQSNPDEYDLIGNQLATTTLEDLSRVFANGPEDVVTILTGALAGRDTSSKKKRQFPFIGPVGDDLADLLAILPKKE